MKRGDVKHCIKHDFVTNIEKYWQEHLEEEHDGDEHDR